MAGSIGTVRDDEGKTLGYRARWRDPDDRDREKRFPTRRKAAEHLALVAADLQRGDYLDPSRGRMLVREVVAEWQAVQVTQRPKTLAGYDAALRTHVLPFLGDRQVASLSPHDIRRNPCGPLRRGSLPRASRQEMLFLSAPQVGQLAAAMPAPYGTLVYFAAYTGMRAGEICALRMPNIDLTSRRVRVVESLSEVGARQYVVPPKTGEERDILLPNFLVGMLARHIDEHPPRHGYLFTGRPPRGRELSNSHVDHRLRHSAWFYTHVYKPGVRPPGSTRRCASTTCAIPVPACS